MMRLVPDLKIEEEKTADQISEFASNEVHCCKRSSINQSNAYYNIAFMINKILPYRHVWFANGIHQ